MSKLKFTDWCAEIDRLAIRDGICEPGASYTKRFGRSYWWDRYYFAEAYMSPGAAWEIEMEDGDA